MTDTRSRLLRCFNAVFPDLNDEEIPRASMTSVGSWDSLASVTLIAVVEEEFDIQVTAEDLEQFVSFELILGHLQELEVRVHG
jgi:acyl carrier protein